MKCILIFPSWNSYETFSKHTARNQVNMWAPLGILYIAGMLIKEGHEVKILDGSFYTQKQIVANVKEFMPHYVGLSSTTFGWKSAVSIAKNIKKIDYNIHVSVGGPYPIAMKEAVFDMKGSENIDSLCYTEGEYVSLEVVDRLKDNLELTGIKGLIYRNYKGEIVNNGKRKPIENLDELPFPPRYLLGDLRKYVSPPGTFKRLPMTTILTSRGCSNLCLYCFQIYRDKHIRFRSAENVVDEMEECIKKYGIKEIKFIDDQFTGDRDRVLKICDLILERKLDISWYASAIANTVDFEMLKKMKDAGCWAILFGAETGVQKNLDTIQKNLTLQDIRNAVKWAKDAGIKPYTPFMFGIPGETYEDGLETIKFACEIDPNYVDFNTLTPFPGTTIYMDYKKYGQVSANTEEYTFQHASFTPYTMSRDEIVKLRQLAFRRFYSRPKYILRKILEVRSLYDIQTLFRGACSLFWIWLGNDIFEPSKIKYRNSNKKKYQKKDS